MLASAKPSQVLITQAFYDKIADSQPALRSSPRAGIYEYLWTSEQRLDKLQAEAEFVPTLVSGVIQPPALADTVVPSQSKRQSNRYRHGENHLGLPLLSLGLRLSLPLRIGKVPSGCLGCGFLPSAVLSRS